MLIMILILILSLADTGFSFCRVLSYSVTPYQIILTSKFKSTVSTSLLCPESKRIEIILNITDALPRLFNVVAYLFGTVQSFYRDPRASVFKDGCH